MVYLDGEPLSRELLDERLAALRAGDKACVLPRPDSREGRQLTRWVAQVIITEQLCVNELRWRANVAPATANFGPETAGVVPATAHVASGTAGVGPTAGVVGETQTPPLDVSTAVAVGSITAAALAGSEAVRRVAAVVSADVRIPAAQLAYAADVLGVEPPADAGVPVAGWHAELVQSARLEAFARWLNRAMYERVQLVHGLEHPGDSNQPDNLHRH
jgi:[acyl-carrier-protein] S-malonyltransferase